MAVTPKDLALSAEEVSLADNLEKHVDNSLVNNFVEGQQISFHLHSSISKRVVNEVIRRYKSTDAWESVSWSFDRDWLLFVPK